MRDTLKFVCFGLAVCFFGWLPVFANGANLLGPDVANTGDLVTVESDLSGEWILTPIKGISFAKDSNGKKIYIVSKSNGEYTIIFFGVDSGKPVLSQKFILIGNGENTDGNNEKNNDNENKNNNENELSSQDKEAFVFALESSIGAIDENKVTTVAGVRSYFKQYLLVKGRDEKGNLRPTVSKKADDLTARADFTSVETLKDSFKKFLKELKPEAVLSKEEWSGILIEGSTENFTQEVKLSKGLCLVLYGSDSCGPCKVMSNYLTKMDIKTVYIDAWKYSTISPGKIVPIVEIYGDGVLKETITGFVTKTQLETKLEKYK